MEVTYKKDWRTPTAIGVGSFLVGVGVGYFVGIRRTKNIIIDETIDVIIEGDTADPVPDEAAAAFKKFADAVRSTKEEANEEIKVPYTENSKALKERLTIDAHQNSISSSDRAEIATPFIPSPKDDPFMDQPDLGWNQAEEEEERTDDAPYVLHETEYASKQKGYRQTILTYYADDNILTDENDIPIYDPSKIVGQLAFGRGSNDPNVVYIRNDKLKAEYAVLRNEGSYQTAILGVEVEDQAEADDLKHSNRIPKFRMD